MTHDLEALAARVEAAVHPSYVLDQDIADAVGYPPRARLPSYTASIDAAVTLVPSGYDWCVFADGFAGVGPRVADEVPDASKCGATPALALCAAALRARATTTETDRG